MVAADETLLKTYLPQVARGEAMFSYALSEREAGSDAAAMKTRAVAKDDGWVLNGQKSWISNAGISRYYTVMAVTDPEKGPRGGISAFVVHGDDEGFSLGTPERLLVNDGTGNFTHVAGKFPAQTDCSRWGELGDLNGDGRLDLVTGQGEFYPTLTLDVASLVAVAGIIPVLPHITTRILALNFAIGFHAPKMVVAPIYVSDRVVPSLKPENDRLKTMRLADAG
jgi:hypothetical protein